MDPIDVLRTNPKKFKRLVKENKVDVNWKDTLGTTLLHIASWRQPSLVEYLIQKGAKVYARNRYKDTPLHWAETREVIETLLAHGAKIHAQNHHLRTPLESACRYGAVEAVRVLYEHGSRVPSERYKVLNEVIALFAGMCWKRSDVGGISSRVITPYLV
jgi:ankyrin repeat protein